MSTTDVTIHSNQIVIKDAVTIVQGGEVVVRLDATYDFSGVDPRYHESIFALILRCNQLVMPTWDDLRRQQRRLEKYDARIAEFKALPWHKRIFAKRPWLSLIEDDDVDTNQ